MKTFENYAISERISAKDEAYWISPKGKILSVEGKHIDVVLDEPESFGYSLEEIQEIYDKYNETIGTEGKAREQIFMQLFRKNWIRIRKYMRPYRWTLNVSKLSSKTKDEIKFFADMMLKKGHSKQDEVLIDTPTVRDIFTFQQLSNDILYLKENFIIPEKRYLLEEVKTFRGLTL